MPDRHQFVELSQGKIWGLNQFTVREPVQITCSAGGVLTLDFGIKSENVRGTYRWEKTILNKTKSGIIYVRTDKLVAEVSASREKDGQINLHTFDVKKLDGITIRVTGIGYLTWLASKVLTIVSNFFPTVVENALKEQIKSALLFALADIKLE